ncbi:MAG: AAA family ATPase [Gammaproteobacteria bacterium]|jgi:MoxR-like ATPase|nr:AAA family ATPase [Gammaproteobacteria bacterium]MBT7370528.1 AAA family ATPase [Gammaproteobacteria bacterium]
MREVIERTVNQIGSVVLGKELQSRLAIACLLSEGHLLIEDMPGMGKTTLAHALAKVFNLSYNRIQFTSDILPADIIGAPIYDKDKGQFEFHPGPIFNQLILADEINRTTPKSQSALLEAMEERQVTVDGESRPLPEPFFVIATQNPSTQAGTFPLPESQLDRFLMRITLGYPDPIAERLLLQEQDRRIVISTLQSEINLLELRELQRQCKEVKVSEALLDYVQRITAYTRETAEFTHGLSPRGAMALLSCAKSWAFMDDRVYVVPEDIQAVLPSVAEHRLREAADFSEHSGTNFAARLLANVDVIG